MQESSRASKGEVPLLYPDSKIEIRGFLARHYDFLLDVATFGWYRSFLRDAIAWMDIQPDDRIIDLGAGTGRNACLMAQYLSEKGRIVGVDIGKDMVTQFIKRCSRIGSATFHYQRIDVPFQLEETFSKAVLSFVLHGFPQEVREVILTNCFNLLDPGGRLVLLDYNTFSLEVLPWYLRIPFKIGECPYAFDFIQRDMAAFLKHHGFVLERTRLFFKGMVRCLTAVREESRT